MFISKRKQKERLYVLKLSKKFNMRLNLVLELLQNLEESFLSSKIPMKQSFKSFVARNP
jgi:hypothetical protein